MFKKFGILVFVILGIIAVFYLWSSSAKNNTASVGGGAVNSENQITVFKSPTCSCCADYINYLKREKFSVKVENVRDTLSIKEKYKVPQELESCHTSVIGNYFVEGHVPALAIKKLLSEKPDILGISLPGMPQGSPGMGGVKKGEFKIYSISSDGKVSDFMSI